jgi:hypothetical protein
MNEENELKVIYDFLGITLTVTTKGNEVKGYICDASGVQSFYLNQKDCLEVSEAFVRLSKTLREL